MEKTILDDIDATLPLGDLLKRLHIAPGSAQADELAALVHEAEAIARPKAISGLSYIDDRGDDYVVIDGVRFDSRVLAVNLRETHRVFPYLATCGVEIDRWAQGLEDVLYRFWSEAIREAAMRKAMAAIGDHLEATYRPGETSRMNPGSLTDWPIEQQVPLFTLFGDTEGLVGVQLTDSMLMIPSKTVSGIRYGASGSFESCMLCPRVSCPNRRAVYDPAMYAERYGR